jgi:hypothetical protein
VYDYAEARMLDILLGVVVVIWGGWYYPHMMRRIRARVAERGGPTEKLDKAIRLRWLLQGCGVLLIAVGIWLVST